MGILRNLFRQFGPKSQPQQASSPSELVRRARDGLVSGNIAAAGLACEDCLELDPDNADALHLLGLVAHRMEDWPRAMALFRRSIERQPGNAEFLNNLGGLLSQMGRADEAAAEFGRALRIDPQLHSARENLLFILPFLQDATGAEIRAEHEAWARLHARASRPADTPRAPPGARAERLRIGYVSADFREHAVSFFMEPVIAAHDRRRFEIFCYSNNRREDAVTARIRPAADHWRAIADLDDAQAAAAIRADGVDILVDLSGHLKGNRLPVFALKPAPLQMTYLGYLVTSGLGAMDYRITDAICDPPGMTEAHYTETLLRLPGCMWCYQPPADAPAVSAAPAARAGKVTFGSTNNPAKITARMLQLWGRILQQVPGSRLLVAGTPALGRERIVEALARGGIGAERIEFHDRVPRPQFLELHGRIDVLLDTFPYNGGTTLCDALWMGVPPVCLIGDWMPARGAASLLRAVGLDGCAVRDEPAYEREAIRLARDLAGTAALRAGMRDRLRASPLLDAARFTRELEALYDEAWRRGPPLRG